MASSRPPYAPCQPVITSSHPLLFRIALQFTRTMSIIKKRGHFSGTPDYLAPETIMGLGYGVAVDYWAVGVILYEMVVGIPPFHDEEPANIFVNILTGGACIYRSYFVPMLIYPFLLADGVAVVEWPEEIDPVCKDLIDKLLTRDPARRLGARCTYFLPYHALYAHVYPFSATREIMDHPFFEGIDWDNLLASPAPFVPQPSNPEDTDYFDARTARPPSLLEDMQNAKHMASAPTAAAAAAATAAAATAEAAAGDGDGGSATSSSNEFGNFSFKRCVFYLFVFFVFYCGQCPFQIDNVVLFLGGGVLLPFTVLLSS